MTRDVRQDLVRLVGTDLSWVSLDVSIRYGVTTKRPPVKRISCMPINCVSTPGLQLIWRMIHTNGTDHAARDIRDINPFPFSVLHLQTGSGLNYESDETIQVMVFLCFSGAAVRLRPGSRGMVPQASLEGYFCWNIRRNGRRRELEDVADMIVERGAESMAFLEEDVHVLFKVW
ncbi:hypothetical protein P691DRAFT_167059 [Macrolepiota fuliginosa MF-IS2]|uniref:Uncharacterized protein n=1 Tax=Macrolepiota fuliginosa MF-IS2 TaxID=1400762 RepID=A0A9P6C0M3_9AGAR|nr:hypothetical protein P691DRAFT_167059 [Macrolepiota fuliginosa MF-IS2]